MPERFRVREPVPMSATLAIHDEVRRLRAAGREVFHLGFGEATFPVHPTILEAFRRSANERTYLPVAGLPVLRETVAAYYGQRFGLEVDASRVLVGCGSKSLLYAALQAVDGDVLLPDPCWVTYAPQARLAGLAVCVVPTSLDDGYCLSAAGLERALDEARATGGRPAALILSSPNNPTGVTYPPELLESLAAVARERQLLVISDEIYALTAYGAVPHRSMARFYPEGTIVTGGISKHLSLGGWRLGVAVLPPGELGARLARCMTAVAGAVWTTPASPVQHAAVVAYSGDPDIDAYVAGCAAVHGRMSRFLYKRLISANVPCAEPSGAFYLYPTFHPWRDSLLDLHGVESCRDLCQLLLREEGIAALPGCDFGSEPRRLSIRLSISQLHTLADGSVDRVLALAGAGVSDEEFHRQACPDLDEVAGRLARFVGSLGESRLVS